MSGTPNYISRGAKDSSGAVEVSQSRQLGQLVLNCFSFSAKGPKKTVGTIGELTQLLGEKTFDPLGKYYFHPIRFMTRFGAPGSSIVFNRILPDDISCQANATTYIDFLETTTPVYVRDSMGNIVLDPISGLPTPDPIKPSVTSYVLKFIKDYVSNKPVEVDGVLVPAEAPALGSLTPIPGTMSREVDDGMGGTIMVTSTMYPFTQANAKEKGSEYSLMGYGFNSYNDNELDREVLESTQAMLYGLTLYKRPDEKSSPMVVDSLLGETSVKCTLKAKQIDPVTTRNLGFEEVFNANWFNENPNNGAINYWEYEGIHLYRENLELILNKIVESEKDFITSTPTLWNDGVVSDTLSWFDFTNEDLEGDEYLFNLFTCKSTKNIPYFTVSIADNIEYPSTLTGNQSIINISNNTPIMLDGSDDGTMTTEELNRKTANMLDLYGDYDSALQDPVLAPEVIFVDSGYNLEVKKAAFNFITVRKDTCILLSTYDYDRAVQGLELGTSDELAMVNSLIARSQMAPESTFFGTECARAAIVMGAGRIGDGSKEYIPNTLEIMGYMTDMMGSNDGQWKETKIFDDRCYSRELVDTVPSFIPNTAKTILWKAGAIFPTPTDRGVPKFIGLQTVYPDATSVLNNIFTMVALCTCERIARNSWLELSGNSRDTPGVFLDKADKWLARAHLNKWANMFLSVPKAYMLDIDVINGNSWRVVTKLYGNVSKTQCVHNTDVFRRGDDQ